MKCLIVILFLIAIVASEHKSYENHKVYEIKARSNEQIQLLANLKRVNGLDFWSRIYNKNMPITIMTHPEVQNDFEEFLKSNNFDYHILIHNVEEIAERERSNKSRRRELSKLGVTFDDFMRHTEINAYLDNLAKKYSDIVTVKTIGKSSENRDLKLIEISNTSNSTNTSKPIIFVDAGIHAREWIAPPVALYIINQLVENSTFHKDMFQNVDWQILPVVNPDGYEYTHEKDRFWRKTRSKGKVCYGVDANRNFDFHWDEVGASDEECDITYAGPKAFSESETQAMRNHILATKNICLYLTFHSFGQYLLYPWGFTEELPKDWKELQALAEDVNKAISAVAGTEYTIGSSTNTLYPAAGGSDDWAKGVGGIDLSYTIELPGGSTNGFDPPSKDILPIVKETFEGIKVYHKYIENKFSNIN